MMHSNIRTGGEREDGFTLIELLVVIIIIGILAAIAIPVFLNQRKKGYDAQARSDVRNLAANEEVYLTDTSNYGTVAGIIANGQSIRVSSGVTLSVVRYAASTSYCISASHIKTGHTFYFDSLAGGMQPNGSSGCPTATTGTAGDSYP